MTCKILIDGKVVHTSPKIVLFDKDGTLIDIHHYWASMIRIRAEKITKQWFASVVNTQKIKNDLLSAMGIDLHSGRIKSDGPVGIKPRSFIVNVAADIVRNEGCDITNIQMEKLFAEVDDATSYELLPLLKVLPGVESLLSKLQQSGIQSIVVSTDITSRAQKAMEVLKLNHYFTEIIGGDQVENTKPASDLADLALARANCPAESAIVIGDHPVDILMGENAGIDLNIGVLTGLSDLSAFKEHKCYVVSDLQSIEVMRSDVNL